jgi:hypothetical protein
MKIFRCLPLSLLAACVLVAACTPLEEIGVRPPPPVLPRGDNLPPSGSIDLGDWRGGAPGTVAQRFSSIMARRYELGSPFSSAMDDLRFNQFACARGVQGRGDPPDQVCRRAISDRGCTHTWQVHLFDDAPNQATKISRVRGLYDKSCAAEDGLLGGPG